MLLENHGIRLELAHPADVARYKSLGWVEVKLEKPVVEETEVPVEPEAVEGEPEAVEGEVVEVETPAETAEVPEDKPKRGGRHGS